MDYRFYTADVFTDRAFGGNPLAVIPDGQGLNDAQMQAVAREFNLSETVFVLPPEDRRHSRRLRIFTPAAELPFAGHPTLGTAHVLAATGAIDLTGERTEIVFEEGVGPVSVTILAVDGRPTFARLAAARLPEVGPPPPPIADLAAMLSLPVSDLANAAPPQAVSCGVPFLFVTLADPAAVARASLDRSLWTATLASFWAPQVFVLSRKPGDGGADVHARMFAPGLGVEEDPATGAAVAALAGYLGAADPRRDGTLCWVVEQGVEMGRPSRLETEADKRDGEIVAVRVGGASVMVSRGEIDIPRRP